MMLTAADRKELLARLSLSAQTSTGKDRDLDMWADAVYRAMDRVIGGESGAGAGPMVIRRYLATVDNWGAVGSFMKQAKFLDLSVTERASVYQMLAQLVVEYAAAVAKRSAIPISSRFVANCSANIAHIFDASFPGYLRAGLAYVVANRHIKGEAA